MSGTTNSNSLATVRVNDPVITQVAHGYYNSESVAPFIAPVVTVATRAGKVLTFGKEQFAVLDLARAPGQTIQRLGTNFATANYSIEQYAVGAEVTQESYEEARNGEARIDLRARATLRVLEAMNQYWEARVLARTTTAANFEAGCKATLVGADKWSDPASDPETQVQAWREAVRRQIGVYPNSMLVSSDVAIALKKHPIFRDRVKYTSSASVTTEIIGGYFELSRGMRVATRLKLGANGLLTDIMPAGTVLLFYSPEGEIGQGFMPASGADNARPSFAYTYALEGYPVGGIERYDFDRRVFVTDMVSEQDITLTGLGETGLVGAGFLASGVV